MESNQKREALQAFGSNKHKVNSFVNNKFFTKPLSHNTLVVMKQITVSQRYVTVW